MKLSENAFLKRRLAVMRLARDLLVTEPNQQLSTIEQCIEEYSVSRGTVQAAMQFLIDNGCVSTQFRGHLGTFLLAKDTEKLWEVAGIGAISGAMPIPLNGRASGFATGICDCMRAKNIPFNCIFVQGSKTRVDGLIREKYDFIVTTKLGEWALRKQYDNIESIADLPNCHYNERHVLLFRDPDKSKIEKGMRVSLDMTSLDQENLTRYICKDVENLVFKQDLSYLNTQLSVLNGESDVTVTTMSTLGDLWPKYAAHIKDLVIPGYTQEDAAMFTTPVILFLKDNYKLDAILQQALNADTIAAAQKRVMDGTSLPNYY